MILYHQPNAIIVDLDGTLADPACRIPYLEIRDWDKFFAGIRNDMLNMWCYNLIQAYRKDDHRIIIMTGRPSKYRAECEFWLKCHAVPYDELVTRPHGVSCEDVAFKRQEYVSRLRYLYDVRLAIDDKPSVFEMWRKQNVPALLCHSDERLNIPYFGETGGKNG